MALMKPSTPKQRSTERRQRHRSRIVLLQALAIYCRTWIKARRDIEQLLRRRASAARDAELIEPAAVERMAQEAIERVSDELDALDRLDARR